jgi:SAM-dependent methyltransferase
MLSEEARKQGQLWGANVESWIDITERTLAPLWDAALTLAEVGEGIRLLDAGCGAGGCLERARLLGATLSGFDPSEGMLAAARRRLPEAELRVGEIGSIPFDSESFDAAVAVNCLQFSPDPAAGVRELCRVVRRGGAAVIVVWNAERSEQRVPYEAIRSLFEKPPSSLGAFELAKPGQLEALIGDLHAEIEEIACPFIYASPGHAIEGQLSTGPSRRAAEIFGRDRVEAALRSAFDEFVQPDGTVRLHNVFRAARIRV